MTNQDLKDLKEVAELIMQLHEEREAAYKEEDYNGAFEIECNQREAALTLAQLILLEGNEDDSTN